jgi:hypothetical protein
MASIRSILLSFVVILWKTQGLHLGYHQFIKNKGKKTEKALIKQGLSPIIF